MPAVADKPAAHLSAQAAVAAGWFTARAAGGPDFTLSLPRRLFLRFYAFLLEGLDSAPIDTLLRSRHIEVTGLHVHGSYLRVYVAATASAQASIPCL